MHKKHVHNPGRPVRFLRIPKVPDYPNRVEPGAAGQATVQHGVGSVLSRKINI